MALSTRVITNRRKRPDQTGTLVGVRLQPDLLEIVDKALAMDFEPKTLSRPDVIRAIIRDWAIGNGLLELPPDREDAN